MPKHNETMSEKLISQLETRLRLILFMLPILFLLSGAEGWQSAVLGRGFFGNDRASKSVVR